MEQIYIHKTEIPVSLDFSKLLYIGVLLKYSSISFKSIAATHTEDNVYNLATEAAATHANLKMNKIVIKAMSHLALFATKNI